MHDLDQTAARSPGVTPARRGRRRLRWVAVLTLLLAAAGLAGLRVVAHPTYPRAETADVVDVIGPPFPSRIAVAHRLLAEGRAKALVITAFDHQPFRRSDLADCSRPQPYPVYCVTPDPLTTQGESRVLAALARQNGWTSATVVTQTFHVARAEDIMARCFPGRVGMAVDRSHVPALEWVYQYAYQVAAFAKLAVLRAVQGKDYCTESGRQVVTTRQVS